MRASRTFVAGLAFITLTFVPGSRVLGGSPFLESELAEGFVLRGQKLGQNLQRRLDSTLVLGDSIPVIVRARHRELPDAPPAVGAVTLSAAEGILQAMGELDLVALRRRQADHSTRRIRELIDSGLGGLIMSAASAHSKYLWSCNAVATRLTPGQIQELARHPDVEAIYEDRTLLMMTRPIEERPIEEGPIEAGATEAAPVWGTDKIGAQRVVEDLGIDGTGVVIGHIDTGVQGDHPLLAGRVLAFKDFVADKTEAYDDNGHGTHTAGTIAGIDSIGVAPGARLVVAKALNGFGGGKLSGLLEAMQWMASQPEGQRPVAVCNSWGIDRTRLSDSEKLFWDATQTWRDAGILPVFASGNSGPDTESIPGSYPMAFAVGATDPGDGSASFSTGGITHWDGVDYVKPDIAAPGVHILSSWPGGQTRAIQGTSMACPHVTGLVALIEQARPGLGPDTLQDLIESTALDLGEPGRDPRFGEGRIDAVAAVQQATASIRHAVVH